MVVLQDVSNLANLSETKESVTTKRSLTKSERKGIMNPKEFFDLVAKMRDKQREYFRTRNTGVLKESKRLEKQVDDEITRVNNVLFERQSPTLFP